MEEEKNNIEEIFKPAEDVNKKQKDRFIIKYIIFVIVLILLTAAAIYYSIEYKSKSVEPENNVINNGIDDKKIAKKESDDQKYLITSYDETYNENSITITNYYDENGQLYTGEYHNYDVQYVQISGLKDKQIEQEINNRLKNTAYLLDNNGTVSERVAGNFANILSVEISYSPKVVNPKPQDYKTKGLNIDLNTGEEIPFEKIFTSSTPIKAILVDGLYEQLAWDEMSKNEDPDHTFDCDMDKADTSDYEDKFIILAKKYENQKEKIEYTISPFEIRVYNLIDKSLINNEWLRTITINLSKYRDNVAIYKRYLIGKDLYENSSIGMKNIIAFTDSYMDDDFKSINYGKIKDNIFLEEVVYCYDQQNYGYCKEIIEKLSKELKEEIKNETKDSEGLICQRIYYVSGEPKDEYIALDISTYNAKCSKQYFKDGIFKDYVEMKNLPRADVGINGFHTYLQEKFSNLKISETKQEIYYLDKNGNIVARSWEEMNELKNEQKEEQKTSSETENQAETTNNAVEAAGENSSNNIVENTIHENSINNL